MTNSFDASFYVFLVFSVKNLIAGLAARANPKNVGLRLTIAKNFSLYGSGLRVVPVTP
jgi:hypothetical protein